MAPFTDHAPPTGTIVAWVVMAMFLGVFSWYYDIIIKKAGTKKNTESRMKLGLMGGHHV